MIDLVRSEHTLRNLLYLLVGFPGAQLPEGPTDRYAAVTELIASDRTLAVSLHV